MWRDIHLELASNGVSRIKNTKKSPGEDSETQSDERSKTFALFTPDSKLAVHGEPTNLFSCAGRWLDWVLLYQKSPHRKSRMPAIWQFGINDRPNERKLLVV